MASHFLLLSGLDAWRGSGSILRAARRWNSAKKDPPIPQMKTGVPSSRSRQIASPDGYTYARAGSARLVESTCESCNVDALGDAHIWHACPDGP